MVSVALFFYVWLESTQKEKKITGTQGAYTQNRVHESCELKVIFLN